jgi:integrase
MSLPIHQAAANDLARLRDELMRQFTMAGPAPCRPIAWPDFVLELEELYKPPQRAPGTWCKLRQVLGHVAELGATTTADLTPALVARFVQSRPPNQSPETTRSLLNSLRAACTIAEASGYVARSPFALRRAGDWLRASSPSRPDRERHHSLEDIRRVLELARLDIGRKVPGSVAQWRARRLLALVSIAAYTGMRRNEILFLRVEDIDLPRRVLWILPRHRHHLKTAASAQPIPIVEPLAAVLAEWLPHLAIPRDWSKQSDGLNPSWNPAGVRDPAWVIPNVYRSGPWTGGSPGSKPLDRVKRLGQRCGIEGFTLLSLRHSYATLGESAWGLSELQIQRVLRDTNTRTQKRYRHADLANLRAALGAVSFGDAPPATSPPPAIAATTTPAEASAAPAGPGPELPAPAPPAKPRDLASAQKPGTWHGPKLSNEDVAEARELRARGWSYSALCARYGVAKSTLNSALYGMTHRDVPMPSEASEARDV